MIKPSKIFVVIGIIVLIPVFFVLYTVAIVPTLNKASCSGVDIFPNPFYQVNSLISSGRYYPDSSFGKKGNAIYRIATGGFDEKVCIKMSHADASTFEVLSKYHAKDKNNAYVQFYYLDRGRSKNLYTIFDIDNETFEILDRKGDYSKDKNNVYYHAKIFKGADPTTFELLGFSDGEVRVTRYTKDKNHVYYDGDVNKDVSGKLSEFTKVADAETFQLLNRYYAKDKNHVYGIKGVVIENADPATFEIIESGTCRNQEGILIKCPQPYDAFDKNNKYKQGKVVIVDPEEEKLMNQTYQQVPNNETLQQVPKSNIVKRIANSALGYAIKCDENGGIVQSGRWGNLVCDKNSVGNWPGDWECGDSQDDFLWEVAYRGQQWEYTIKCKNHPECSGIENVKCTKEGCVFSESCD